jgi:hypothetical protein
MFHEVNCHCPISMIMAVDRGCGLRDDKLVDNQVPRVISTDLASCWIIVRVLNDHDEGDTSDLRPDRLIETAVPGFSSKLALSFIPAAALANWPAVGLS